MIFSVDDIKRDVRIALDQNNSSTSLLDVEDIDTLTLEEIIEGAIPAAAEIVMKNAPIYLLGTGKAFGDSVGWDGDLIGIGSGYIHLPDDFLRLISFQMSDWDYPITEAITEEHPLYRLQSNRYVRGNPQKPIVAITNQPVGLVLEFYSCTKGKSVFVKRARYIPKPKIVDGFIDISENLYKAIIYYAGYLTAKTIGNDNLAEFLKTTSVKLQDNETE